MGRLCKGLHYALWMQDDMLIQEKLADNIASLIGNFRSNEHSAQFIMHMLLVLSNEWHRIDRWRMDKFLMVFFVKYFIFFLFILLNFLLSISNFLFKKIF